MNLSFDDVIPYPVLSRQSLPYHFVSLTITNLITKSFFRTLKSPHPFEFILWWRHSLSRAITTNPALSLVILSYHPSYNQDFSELWKSSPKSCLIWIYNQDFFQNLMNLSFDDVIPYPVLSPQILPYHLLSLAITHLITKIFQNSEITPPLRTYRLITSFLIPCYHAKSCLITSYP